MSSGRVCDCPESQKRLLDRNWTVTQFRSNRSAFNGYQYTPSEWSAIRCNGCSASWRTKAYYAIQLNTIGKVALAASASR